MIWAIILAAGESKRMGQSKLLLPLGEKTIIETIIENVVSSNVHGTVVVLGSGWRRIRRRIHKYPVKMTINPHFKKGMLSSVQWGFQVLPEETKAALVFLGDQPLISKDTINLILEAFRGQRKGIVIPVCKKGRGHPVLIDTKYRKEIHNLDPKIGLRQLIYSHPEDILEVEVGPCPGILSDIDNWQDYEKQLMTKRK